jgi:Fe2+ transport system protein B
MLCRFSGPASSRKFTPIRIHSFAVFVLVALHCAAAGLAIAHEGHGRTTSATATIAATNACLSETEVGNGTGEEQ